MDNIDKIVQLVELKKFDVVKKLLDIEIVNYPDDPRVYFFLGLCDSVAFKDSKAKIHFDRALELNPENHHTYNQLAILALRNKEYQKVEELSRVSLSIEPCQEFAFTNMAIKNLRIADIDSCRRECQQALQFNPNSTKALCLLAECHLLKKEYESALQTLNMVLKKEPTNPEALLSLSKYAKDVGNNSRSEELLENAIMRAPTNPSLKSAIKRQILSTNPIFNTYFNSLKDSIYISNSLMNKQKWALWISCVLGITTILIFPQKIADIILVIVFIWFSWMLTIMLFAIHFSNILVLNHRLGKHLVTRKEIIISTSIILIYLFSFAVILKSILSYSSTSMNFSLLNGALFLQFTICTLNTIFKIKSRMYSIITLTLLTTMSVILILYVIFPNVNIYPIILTLLALFLISSLVRIKSIETS